MTSRLIGFQEQAEIEAKVEEAMRHLKFEVKDESGKWKEVNEEDLKKE